MKKTRIFILLMLCIIILSGCTTHYDENMWYSEETLAQSLVPDLPKIETSFLNDNNRHIYTSLKKEEFDTYVQSIYDYLKAQNFAYLGAQGNTKASLAGFLTSYYFQPTENLEQHYKNGNYYFIYSDGTTDESGNIVFYCLIIQNSYGSGYSVKHNGKEFYYNTILTLRKNSDSVGRYYYDPEGIDPCFFGHTYDEGTVYPIPGSEQTVAIRHCINCAAEDYEPFSGNLTTYSLTIAKGGEHILCLPETHVSGKLTELPSGMLMKIYTRKLIDADIVFTVNSTEIPKKDTEKGWLYAFILPNCDVEISIEVIDGFLPPAK